jgi:DNA-binding response OmpR family regulator
MREGKGTILVLDDEPSLRLLCRVNLELEGYRVLEAATLDEARTAMDDVLGKPFALDDLAATVERVLAGTRRSPA